MHVCACVRMCVHVCVSGREDMCVQSYLCFFGDRERDRDFDLERDLSLLLLRRLSLERERDRRYLLLDEDEEDEYLLRCLLADEGAWP